MSSSPVANTGAEGETWNFAGLGIESDSEGTTSTSTSTHKNHGSENGIKDMHQEDVKAKHDIENAVKNLIDYDESIATDGETGIQPIMTHDDKVPTMDTAWTEFASFNDYVFYCRVTDQIKFRFGKRNAAGELCPVDQLADLPVSKKMLMDMSPVLRKSLGNAFWTEGDKGVVEIDHTDRAVVQRLLVHLEVGGAVVNMSGSAMQGANQLTGLLDAHDLAEYWQMDQAMSWIKKSVVAYLNDRELHWQDEATRATAAAIPASSTHAVPTSGFSTLQDALVQDYALAYRHLIGLEPYRRVMTPEALVESFCAACPVGLFRDNMVALDHGFVCAVFGVWMPV